MGSTRLRNRRKTKELKRLNSLEASEHIVKPSEKNTLKPRKRMESIATRSEKLEQLSEQPDKTQKTRAEHTF